MLCFLIFLGVFGGLLEYFFLRYNFNPETKIGWAINNYVVAERETLRRDAEEIVPWLQNSVQHSETVDLWSKAYVEKLTLKRKTDFEVTYQSLTGDRHPDTPLIGIAIYDSKGRIVSSSNNGSSSTAVFDKDLILRLLKDGSNQKVEYPGELSVLFAFPVTDKSNKVVGALLFRERLPFSWFGAVQNSFLWVFNLPLSDLAFLAAFGFAFGLPFAWYLSGRLENITAVAHSWQNGDFSIKNQDRSPDEVGILSRQLNEMADELNRAFALKQIVAISEERNRIARDLHDSVKQRVFGLGMQISTARTLLGDDRNKAKLHLDEASNLVGQIQKDLVELIQKLKPIADKTGIIDKISAFGGSWSRQSGVEFELKADPDIELSPAQYESVYRITQEALANIARHSQASQAIVEIRREHNQAELRISDDGIGFDYSDEIAGYGLKNMRERAEQLPTGQFFVESILNKGTELRVRFRAIKGLGRKT